MSLAQAAALSNPPIASINANATVDADADADADANANANPTPPSPTPPLDEPEASTLSASPVSPSTPRATVEPTDDQGDIDTIEVVDHVLERVEPPVESPAPAVLVVDADEVVPDDEDELMRQSSLSVSHVTAAASAADETASDVGSLTPPLASDAEEGLPSRE